MKRRLSRHGSGRLERHLLNQLRTGTTVTQKANPRAFPLSSEASERKSIPITTGVIDYFPNALAEVAKVSVAGSKQHHPGEPLHWERDRSTDHADCIGRHLLERGTFDSKDGQRHSAKLAWRALALLQEELEAEMDSQPSPENKMPENTWICYCDTGYVCQGCDIYNCGRPYKRSGPTYQDAYAEGLVKYASKYSKPL